MEQGYSHESALRGGELAFAASFRASSKECGTRQSAATTGNALLLSLALLFLCVSVSAQKLLPPAISSIPGQNIDEDTSTGPLPFTISDPDTALAGLTLSKSSSNTDLVPATSIVFGGSGANRTVRVTPRPNAFGETVITLNVSDGQLATTVAFSVTVRPVNDPPVLSNFLDANAIEDTPTAEIAFSVNDLETVLTSLTVSGKSDNQAIVPDASIAFGGSGANRTVKITPLPNANGPVNITISVNDGQDSTSRTFRLGVQARNDGPSISAIADQVIDEDKSSAALPFTIGDIDTLLENLTVAKTSSDGILLPAANIVLGGSGANRTVTITPAANRSGTVTVRITVNDGGVTPATEEFTVTINPVNDAPTISDVSDQATNEGTTKTISFNVGDIDSPVANLTATGDSSNPVLVPNGNIKLSGTASLRTASIIPVPNQSGTTTITLRVTDPGGQSTEDSFVLTVAALDNGPTISDTTDKIVEEDTVIGPLAFTIGDPDTPLDQLTLTTTSSLVAIVPLESVRLAGAGANRTVTITPAANATGTSVINIHVSDGTTVVQDSFRVTFNAVNDPPTLSDIGNQTVPRNGNTGPLTFQIGDVETGPGALTLSKTSDNLALIPLAGVVFSGGIGSARTVTVTPAPNQIGSANLTVTVSDAGGATASDSFTVTVAGAGNPPQITKQPEGRTVALRTSLTLEVAATGDAPLRYQWRFKGQNIPNATSATLTIPSITTAAQGDFDVVVTNESGSTTSNKATVTVDSGQPAEPLDYGDAPDAPYPTTLAHNGASQRVQNGFSLGATIDGDDGTLQNSTATADGSDEDGVLFLDPLIPGQVVRIRVLHTRPPAANSSLLSAWIDWSNNGSWAEAGDRIINNQPLNSRTNDFNITVPANAAIGFTFSRFRLYTDQNPGFAGASAEAGEVEDYQVEIGTGGGTQATQDFGDAPDSYQSLLANDGPRHTRLAGFHLGKIIDLETNTVPPLNGFGDDSTPAAVDDEDGVTLLSAITTGQSLAIQVVVTSTVGNGKLDAWADWNRNGSFAEINERIFTSLTVTNGTNNLPAFIVPANASPGPSYTRFRLTRQGVNSWFGPAPDGEVEDYAVNIRRATQAQQFDFGDAPQGANAGYPTKLDRNGARHSLNDNLHLGKSIDLENDGQPNLTATGDDTNGSADEDGVFFPAPLAPGTTASVEVEVATPAGQTGVLDAFVDFNADGDWSDADEKIISARAVANGSHTITFTVPANAKPGVTFARFRLSLQPNGLSFDGDGGPGEVEDVRVSIEQADQTNCDLSCVGTDFWISFPGNYAPDPANPVKPILAMNGPVNTVITIENLANSNLTRWTNTTGTLRIELNKITDLGDLNDAIVSKGVHVTADQPIQLYGLSKVTYTSDGFLALPTEALGTDHVIAGFGNVHSSVPELNGSQFAVVATRTNTLLTIIPSVATGARPAGLPYSLTLTNRGDCYQLRSTNDVPSDLTGTIVLSDQPVAVFGGHQIANVASADPFFADYLVEQLLPVSRWGREFYTSPLTNRTGGDTFRIVAGHDNTVLTIDANPSITLTNKGAFHETLLASAAQIVSDKPVLVMQYANSSDFDGVTNSDPFMVTVPARSHWSTTQTFTTPGTGFASYHINVVVPATASASLLLDGSAAAFTSFSVGINGSGIVYARAAVTAGTHTITCDEPVGVIVYGWGLYESFAWPACLFLGDTTPPIVTCNTQDVTVQAGRDSDNEPCKGLVRDYRQGVRATDNCGLPLQTTVEQTPRPGTFVGVGTHAIKLSVRDNAGNVGSCSFNFTVTDPNPNGPIKLDCPKDMLVRCTDATGAIVNYSVTALRGCTPLTSVVECVPPSGSHFPRGTNVVNCTLSVPGQPSQACSFKVIVNCQRPDRTVKISPPTIDPAVPGGVKELVIEFEPDSNVVLEVADSITGPWVEVPNVPSRYAIKIAQEKGKFFRLREKTPAP